MLVVTDLSGNSEIINKFNNFEMYEELNGSFTLSFTSYSHIDNPGHDLIIQEGFVESDGYKFRIKQLRKQINSIQVSCISTYYDNADVYKYDIYGGTRTLNQFLTYVLANTGWTWTSTNIDVEESKFIPNFGQNNVIQLIEILKGAFGLEVGINRNSQIVVSDALGPDNEFQYRYGYNIISLAESIDTTKLKTYIEGFGANGIHVTYTSPYASSPGIGIRHAEPIHDDSYTDANALLEYMKTQLYDHPDSVIELDDNILINKELGERVWVIHERMGIEYQTRVVSRRIKIPNSLSSVVLGTYLPQSRSISNELITQRVTIDKNNTINRSRIEQTNAKIELEVTRLDGADATLLSNLTIEADRITTEVSERQSGDDNSRSYTEQTATSIRSEVSTEVTRLDGRVDSSDSLISQSASEILLRVREDGVISSINQTAEAIRISASKIDLQGSVTVSDLNPALNSKFTKIDSDGVYTGVVNADQIIAQYGYITQLTVDEVETSDKIQRYRESDTTDVNYIRAKEHRIEWVTAHTDGLETVPATDRKGAKLYWTDETKTSIALEDTGIPVYTYVYEEFVKRKISFEDVDGLYIPVDEFGDGDGVANHGKGFIHKRLTGLDIEYEANNTGELRRVRLDNEGVSITPAIGGIASQFMEHCSAAWDSAGVTFTLQNGYTEEPMVTTGVQGSPSDFSTASFTLVVEHIKEVVNGQSVFSKIKITPVGSNIPSPTEAKIVLHATCHGIILRS